MSEQEQETMADIIREKRETAAEIRAHLSIVPARREDQMLEADSLDREADRIEATWKRDEERAVEHATRHAEAVARDNCRDCVHNPRGKNYEGGNAAAMREALVFLRDQELWMLEGNVRHCIGLTVFGLEQTCKIMRGVIEEALAAPPRNCDVGTADEQDARFGEFCVMRRTGTGSCAGCPAPVGGFTVANGIRECALVWAQVPYEASEISRAHRAGEKTTNQTTRNNNEQ